MINFVNNLQNGLDTIVGERGSRISGGQLQRVGIARALYNDPKILIFDESTSALDKETELEIIKNIYKFKSKKTLIIITHKKELLKECDKIYKLENGNLKENDFAIQDSNNTPLYDINYNTWNIDLNCIWRFAPGSELNCQWKNSISNLISDANLNALENLNRLFEESQGNSLSLRMVYFLDYQYLKNRNK